ncbi:hypothetical protein BHM03_00052530 [Ensete ventricosum]|nr:hypothetical protein BHM03_00052530 [Ensete ventricosum]
MDQLTPSHYCTRRQRMGSTPRTLTQAAPYIRRGKQETQNKKRTLGARRGLTALINDVSRYEVMKLHLVDQPVHDTLEAVGLKPDLSPT